MQIDDAVQDRRLFLGQNDPPVALDKLTDDFSGIPNNGTAMRAVRVIVSSAMSEFILSWRCAVYVVLSGFEWWSQLADVFSFWSGQVQYV